MDLDNRYMEFAYALIFICSWIFTFSQLLYAVRYGGGWRWSCVFWLTTKSVFLTNAGMIWWLNWANPILLQASIFMFAFAHLEVLVHWLRLEDKGKAFVGTNSDTNGEQRAQMAAQQVVMDEERVVLTNTSLTLARRGEKLSDAGVILDDRRLSMDIEGYDLADQRHSQDVREKRLTEGEHGVSNG